MIAMVMIASLTYAQPGKKDGGPESDRKQKPHHPMAKLELSDEQKEKMEELRLAHQKATKTTKNQLKIKQAELEAAVEADKPVAPLVKDINALRAELFTAKINNRVAMRAVLDEKQKLIFDGMKDHRERREGKHGAPRRGK